MKEKNNMEDFIKIENVESPHIEETKQYECHRFDYFDAKGYKKSMEIYHHQMYEYKKKNWFKRLFYKKPIEPDIKYFYKF